MLMTGFFLLGLAQALQRLILDGEYGVMVGIVDGKIKRVPLAECAGKLKIVDPNDQDCTGCKADRYQFWRLRDKCLKYKELIYELYCSLPEVQTG